MSRKSSKSIILVVAGIVVVSAVVFGAFYLARNVFVPKNVRTVEDATSSLQRMVNQIDPQTATPKKSSVEYTEQTDTTAEELPELESNKVTAKATTDLYAEIWCSPEKAGSGTDGWMRELAEQFNAAGYQVDGQRVSVQIRNVSSGLGNDYITTGKATPDGYTPSSRLWIDMLAAKGINCDYVRDRTVGNVAGFLLNKKLYDSLVEKYGQADLKALTEATGDGLLTMGYTNPFTSSTGLNFLISTLQRYDRNDPLSESAVEGFRKFQANVPFVAMTTVQMRDAAERGSFDGLVLEYQLYQNDAVLNKAYKFVPFGYRHDNPLVVTPSTSDAKRQIIELFATYCDENGADLANRYGFNGLDDYKSENPEVDGNTLISAQKLYKDNKDNGKPVVAVFVADISGSMDGAPLRALQESLINSMRYINSNNYVGLVSYSDYVTIELPIAQFDLNQQAYFKGAVESLRAGGGTATFDGICVAADMVQKALAEHPDAKPLIFVLSDGETNSGYDLSDVSGILKALRIPVYTIGYNANIDALKQISSINEAASIDASTDDVVYQLKNLFNANM
ncbi:MAG: VWA domain-containing protein [Atopobiaceae bacterium]|nr:VWA domain-containing protein [Atopobiaceae bacterium]